MSYVAPVHKPTSIRHAVRVRLLSPDHEDLAVAKTNRLEIWRLTDEGMVCLHTKLIYGTIAMLQKLQPKDSETELLFVGTDRLQYFSLVWNPKTSQLDAVEDPLEDTAEPYMRTSQSQNKCLVDPTGRFMAMHLWEGVLNIFRLRTRKGLTTKLEVLDQVRLTELWMKSSVFLHSRTGHPKIAFLFKSQLEQEEARLAVYRLTKDDKGGDASKFDPHKDRELDQVIPDPYASILIPVPVYEEKRYHVRHSEGAKAHLGGLLVVGETLLTYFDSLTYTSVASALTTSKLYVAWAEYDNTHYFLADDYGQMDLLTIETSLEPTGMVVTGLSVAPFSFPDSSTRTSRAATLVYMGDNALFLASHHGDSQLLRVDIESRTIIVSQILSNNAPILDFAIMDMGNREGDNQLGNAFSSGQARIVAGCGAYQDGTLRSIRSGVGLEDRGVLEDIEGTKGLFSVRSHKSQHINTLIASFIGETRVFTFDSEGGIEEVFEFQGIYLDEETLLAASLPNGQFLQITPQSVVLLDAESGVALNTWSVPEGKMVTSASANSNWALLAIDGLTLVSLNLLNGLAACVQEPASSNSGAFADQISCLHAAINSPDIGLVGWWTSGSVSIVDLATLKALHGEPLRQTSDSASVPRDIALVQLHQPEAAGPTLLIALEDGNVMSFDVSMEGLVLSGRKTVTLGSSPARLHILPQDDGTSNVFATTEHSSLIYSSENRIIYSATTADDATFVVPFDAEAYPDSIILSTDRNVRLSHVDKERLTHVKALAVNETVRRVAYSPNTRSFGLGCVKKELIHNEEVITSTFRLVDEIVFKELGKPFPINGSVSLEIVECVIRAELPDSSGNLAERFIVGTGFIADDDIGEAGDTRGRILVLGVDENRQVYQVLSHNLKGACRCLGVMDDYKIVAGLNKTVVVYDYMEETSTTASLQKLAAHRPSAFPVDLDISGSIIGIVDIMQSLSLVEFIPGENGEPAKLQERARHYRHAYTTSVCHLTDDAWLEADALGNIVVLRRNREAPTEQDQRRLEITGEMNIGEQINRIRRLHVASNENAIVTPQAFLGSVEGSLYLFGEISPKYQDLLLTFQSRLKEYISTPGQLDFDTWRAFRDQTREAESPFRFVDGEMVERFLDLDEGRQELVVEGLGPSVEDMRNMIEELRRMH